MPDLDYTVELTIGSLSWTIHDGDVPNLSAGPVVLAGLRIRWQYADTPLRPAQPEPMTSQVAIAVKDAAELEDLDIGDTVRIDVWVGPVPAPVSGHQHSQTARFMGRIAEMAAAPWTFDDGVLGMLYTFELVDHIADLNEALLGHSNWPAESQFDRVNRIKDVIETYFTLPPIGNGPPGGQSRYVAFREGDPVPAGELLEEYLRVHVLDAGQYQYVDSAGLEVSQPFTTRPIVSVNDGYRPSFEPIDLAPGGAVSYLFDGSVATPTIPHVPGVLPGRLVVVAGVGVVSWEPTAASAVPVIDAGIVERPDEWLRTKGTAFNTITVKTDDDTAVTVTTEDNTRHRSAALLETDIIDDPGGLGDTAVEVATTVGLMYLPRQNRGHSGWTLDGLVVRAEQLPSILAPHTAAETRHDGMGGTENVRERGYGWFPGTWLPAPTGRGTEGDGAWCLTTYPVHPVVIHGLPSSQHPEGRTTLYGIPDAVELVLAPRQGRCDLVVQLRQGVPSYAITAAISSDDLAARVDLAGLTYNDLDPLLTCDDLAFVRGT